MEELFLQLRRRLEERPGQRLNLPGLSLREAAVLVPLFSRDGQVFVLFTKRPMTLRLHPGQISFPGGSRDPEDGSPLHTALRETQEELGIPSDRVEVLGMLEESPTITSFRVTPFVGVIPAGFPYRPNPDEIEEIIEVPLNHLLNPAVRRSEQREVFGKPREIYFYEYGKHTIWGATARILKTLFDLAGDLPAFQRLVLP